MSINGKAGRVLLTGGRAPAALEIARLLAEAGHTVFAAESLRHHLCRWSRAVRRSFAVPSPAYRKHEFIQALAQLLVEERIDTLVPTCEEIMYVAEGMKALPSGCRVLAHDQERLQRLHNKWEFIRHARSLGFEVPHTELIESAAQWRKHVLAAVQSGAGSVILKPVYSRFASHVRMAERAAVEEAPVLCSARPWVAQEYIRGREICTYSVAHQGRLLAFAAYAAVYRAGRGANIYFEPLRHRGLLEWVERFVRLESFTGQIAFDFIETPEGRLYPLECNPRATSGVHLFRGHPRFAAALVQPEQLDGEPLEPLSGARAMLAVPMLAYGLRADRSAHGLRSWLSRFVSAKDAVLRWSDPAPFAAQAALLGELGRIGRKRGVTLAEAATLDLEWNGC